LSHELRAAAGNLRVPLRTLPFLRNIS